MLRGFALDVNVWYRRDEEEEWMKAVCLVWETLMDRTHGWFMTPVGVSRFEITKSPDNNPMLASVHVEYCNATGNVCGGVDLYLSVCEGEISVSWCPSGYSGYWYGVWLEVELGDVEMDECV